MARCGVIGQVSVASWALELGEQLRAQVGVDEDLPATRGGSPASRPPMPCGTTAARSRRSVPSMSPTSSTSGR